MASPVADPVAAMSCAVLSGVEELGDGTLQRAVRFASEPRKTGGARGFGLLFQLVPEGARAF